MIILRTIIISILVMLILCFSSVRAEIQPDKVGHFLFGYMGQEMLEEGLGLERVQTFFIIFCIGYAKEISDLQCGRKFDNDDMFASVTGQLLSVSIKF